MKRLLVLVLSVVAVVAAAALVVAAFVVPSTAATVNGQDISQSTLNGQLAAIDASPAYQCYLQASVLLDSQGQSELPPIAGAGQAGGSGSGGIYNGAFVRYWLSRLVSAEIVSQAADRRGITVSSAQRAATTAETEQVINGTFATLEQDGVQPNCSPVPTGAQVLASLPSSFVDSLVRAQASSDLLAASVVGSDLSGSSMDRYFESHRSDFDTLCVDGFSVTSQASAAQIRAAIAAGTPFAKAAPAGTTVQSACFPASSSSYQAIRQAVGGLSIGGVSQPVQGGSTAYYLFQLTGRTPIALEGARGLLRGAIVNAGLSRADQLLTAAERRSTITVDPRYGKWTATPAAVGVLPPPTPPISSMLNPVANTPPGSASGPSGSG